MCYERICAQIILKKVNASFPCADCSIFRNYWESIFNGFQLLSLCQIVYIHAYHMENIKIEINYEIHKTDQRFQLVEKYNISADQ